MNTLSSSQIPFMLVVNHIAAGMTIPTLALEIDISNKESGEEPLLNLKGYFAGNPMTDDRFDTAGKIQFFHGMGVIPNELYEIAKENCRGNYSDPPSASCAESMQAIDIKKVSNTTTQTRNCTLLKRMDPWLKLREPRNHLKLN